CTGNLRVDSATPAATRNFRPPPRDTIGRGAPLRRSPQSGSAGRLARTSSVRREERSRWPRSRPTRPMENRIQHARPHVARNEALIFERTLPGKSGVELPPLDVPGVAPEQVLGQEIVRSEIEGFPEVSEVDVIRHFTRLSTCNYGIDTGLYPLGSCTM